MTSWIDLFRRITKTKQTKGQKFISEFRNCAKETRKTSLKFSSKMDVDDEKYLKALSSGPPTPNQIHLQQLTPPHVYMGGSEGLGLDPIKEESCENMGGIDPSALSGMVLNSHNIHGMMMRGGERDKGTFWPEKPKPDNNVIGAAGVKASTVLTNLQRGNIPTIMQTVVEPVFVAGPHQRAGQGELRPDDLIENDVNERDGHGRTPLMWSASYGQSPTISLLMR